MTALFGEIAVGRDLLGSAVTIELGHKFPVDDAYAVEWPLCWREANDRCGKKTYFPRRGTLLTFRRLRRRSSQYVIEVPMVSDARPRSIRWAAFFAVAACASLTIDVPVARCQLDTWPLGDFRKMLDISEVFAHGFGAFMILMTVAVLDPLNRPRLPRVAACAFGAGLMAQVAKQFFPRMRPYAFDASGDVRSTFLAWGVETHEQAVELGRQAIQSFPSGHTATAVGLALGLAWLYPRGRWLFAFFAFLAAVQRVWSSAHYVSDTLAAAAMASVVAGAFLTEHRWGRWFTRFEQSRQRTIADPAEPPCTPATVQVSPPGRRAA